MMRTVLVSIITVLSALSTCGQDADTRYIREDRLWEYYKSFINNENGTITRSRAIMTYRFNGTESRFGREYDKCILEKAALWQEVYDPNLRVYNLIGEVETKELNECVGLVREGGSKVFLLPETETLQTCSMPYMTIETEEIPEGNEVLLFDFSVKTGNVIYPYLESFLYGPMVAESYVRVANKDNEGRNFYFIENKGLIENDHDYEYWGNCKILIDGFCKEGIGNVGSGEMLRFGGVQDFNFDLPQRKVVKTDLMSDWQQELIQSYLVISGFNNYCDLDGNILYEGEGIQAPDPSGVAQIVDSVESHTPIYDIMGRRVKETVPGSICICGGKKFVAK